MICWNLFMKMIYTQIRMPDSSELGIYLMTGLTLWSWAFLRLRKIENFEYSFLV